jgi:hypothetical protein
MCGHGRLLRFRLVCRGSSLRYPQTGHRKRSEGLGEFLDSAGFSSQFEIRPIEQEETCDYFAPDSADWKPCGEKATFAKYVLDTSLLCAEHAAAMTEETGET